MKIVLSLTLLLCGLNAEAGAPCAGYPVKCSISTSDTSSENPTSAFLYKSEVCLAANQELEVLRTPNAVYKVSHHKFRLNPDVRIFSSLQLTMAHTNGKRIAFNASTVEQPSDLYSVVVASDVVEPDVSTQFSCTYGTPISL